jgi:hypothetical protein
MPTLRIEFVKLAQGRDGVPDATAIATVLGESELTIGASATVAGSQPAAPAGTTHAILTAVGGAAYVDWDGNKTKGSSADPSTAKRVYVPSGGSRTVAPYLSGAKFSTIQASIT